VNPTVQVLVKPKWKVAATAVMLVEKEILRRRLVLARLAERKDDVGRGKREASVCWDILWVQIFRATANQGENARKG
jgi:hypothetical protein